MKRATLLNFIYIIFSLFINSTIFAQSQLTPNIQWQKCLGGTGYDEAESIQQTSDGGYIVGAFSTSNDGDVTGIYANNLWIVKLNSVGSIIWQKCLGGAVPINISSIHETSDGGYIVAANCGANGGDVSGNHGNSDYWIVKLNYNGNIEWQKSLGGSGIDVVSAIEQTTDAGYIVAGRSSSNDGDVSGNHDVDYWIVKLNSVGNIDWQKCFGGTGYDNATSIQQTIDGGYIVGGYTSSYDGDVSGNHGSQTNDSWIVKLSSSGNMEWQKCLGGSLNEFESSIIRQTQDGGYILAQRTQSNDGDVSGNHGSVDAWIVKLSNNGSILWQKCFGGSNDDAPTSIKQTSDGGYIFSGNTDSNNGDASGNHGSIDVWIVKLASNGSFVWQKSMGSSSIDEATSIQQTTDGGYIGCGATFSNDGDVSGNHGGVDAWIIKLSADPPQTNSYNCYLKNIKQIDRKNIEFEIWLEWTGTNTQKIAFFQAGIDFNYAGMANGGTITGTFVQGSADPSLPLVQQAPNMNINQTSKQIRILAAIATPVSIAVPIPPPPGFRILRFHMTNTVDFTAGSTPNFVWRFIFGSQTTTQTRIDLYLAGSTVGTNVTTQAQHFVASNPILNCPDANTGGPYSSCSNVQLNGSILNANFGTWASSGTGTFEPGTTTLNAIYHPSAGDLQARNTILTLSTDVGSCTNYTNATFTFSDNNLCTTDACDPLTGQDTHILLSNIDDGNPNTIDFCNSTTGIVTHLLSLSGLISYWNFDGNVIDQVSSNDGINNGVSLLNSSGKINQGAQFNGSNIISVPDNLNLSPSNFSLSLWIKPNVLPVIDDVIGLLDKRENINGFEGWCLELYNHAGIQGITLLGDVYGNCVISQCPYTLPTTTFTHIVVTKEEGFLPIKYYINGNLVYTDNNNCNWQINNYSTPLVFGSRSNSLNHFQGSMDEIGIWSRALEASEIIKLYNNGNGLQYPFDSPLTTVSNISFTNHIDKSHFPDKELWSGNINHTPSNPAIKICADGSDATQIKYVNNNLNIRCSDIKFLIHSDLLEQTPEISGRFENYKINGNVITVTLKHPNYFTLPNDSIKNDVIDVIDYATGQNIYHIPITIYRAPILFIHGFELDQEDHFTFYQMATYLCQQGMYPANPPHHEITGDLFYNIPYYSFANFETNCAVPRTGIDKLFEKLRSKNISAGKVDVITHSMGGILTRLYLQNNYGQEYKNDIHKFIQLNCPNSGTNFVTYMYVMCEAFNYIFKWGITCPESLLDMGVDSYAMDHILNDPAKLNSQNKVPTHVITSDFSPFSISSNPKTKALVQAIMGTTVVGSVINQYESLVFDDESNDFVIPLSSQRGGILGNDFVSFHLPVMHAGAADNIDYKEDVANLLNADPEGFLFTSSGFDPSDITIHNTNVYANRSISTSLNTDDDSVLILSPTPQQIFQPGDTIQINISGTVGIDKIMTAIGNESVSLFSNDTLNNNQSFMYVVPENANGDLRIITIASDSVGFLDLDSLTIKITPQANIDSIYIEPSEIYCSVNERTIFNVFAIYSDGIIRNITFDDSLEIEFADTSIAKRMELSSVIGIKAGMTNAVISFKNNIISIPVKVASGILFSADTTYGCTGSTINFTGEFNKNPNSIFWLFPGGISSNDTIKNPSVTYNSEGSYSVSLIATYTDKVDTFTIDNFININSCPKTLNIELLLQGFYDGDGNMLPTLYTSGNNADMNICDSITVELHNSVFPFELIYSNKTLLSTKGNSISMIPNQYSGYYYIVINHRNSLETWSSDSINFNSSLIDYNFKDNSSKSFGNNMSHLPNGLYALYSGDVNQDGLINQQDYSNIENISQLFLSGYTIFDLTGDNIVESEDYSLIENNEQLLLMVAKP